MPPVPPTPSSSTATSATLPAQSLPALPTIPIHPATLDRISPPYKRIGTDADTLKWIHSDAHAIYSLFIQRIAEACVGKATRPLALATTTAAATAAVPLRSLPTSSSIDPATSSTQSDPLGRLATLLQMIDSWTDEIEPQAKPQRFGNLAFRDWGARLEERAEELHRQLLPVHLHPFIPELSSYLLDSFGSFVRIDYGSGHEFCFAAWLCYLYRLGFFDGQRDSTEANQETEEPPEASQPPTLVEERLGLEVFPLYLYAVWRLQDRYGLEPAGSHGVWGLDDYQFLPYVFGAAQLRRQSSLRPSTMVPASSHAATLSSLPGKSPAHLISHAPKLPASLLASGPSADGGATPPPPLPNLYLTSLLRIQVLKSGPFHEHSPLLHDISTSVPNWIKTYTGMVKMYEAECLGKRVVVQHFKFGGVGWVWPDDGGAAGASGGSTGLAAMGMGRGSTAGTGQPNGWALGMERGNASSMGIPTTRMTAPAPQPGAAGGARLPASLVPATMRAPFGPTPTGTGIPVRPAAGVGPTPMPTRTVGLPPSTRAPTRTSDMAPPPQPGSRPRDAASVSLAAVPTPTRTTVHGPTPALTRSAAAGPTPQPSAVPAADSANELRATNASRAGPTPTTRPSD